MRSPDISRRQLSQWRIDTLREVAAPRWLIWLYSKRLRRQERNRR
jgi:hypothetical protein